MKQNPVLHAAVKLVLLASAATMAANVSAQEALPTGGQIVSGQGTITESAGTLTVTQFTDRMIANWQSFSIAADHSVNFVQPDASSVALNRVIGQDPSQILGSLDANGQVFLVNPNGVMIGRDAQVHTGGFVASSLDIDNQDFLAGVHRFTGVGGAVANEGEISGQVVALIAPSVSNAGTITGNTVLAAGTNVLLDFAGDGLLSVEVSASTVATLVENKGLIRADGGVAILTARGASDALQGVVNNSGTIQARTLANRSGRILLLADMNHGDVNVDGTLDASAPNGGDGGFIETSAANVRIADDVRVTTRAASGTTGDWLIDPNDFTIAASGGNISGRGLSTSLAGANIIISTAIHGTPEGNGDIFVNDTVNWAASTLTLSAERNIVINATLNASDTAGLTLRYGQGAPALNNTATYVVNAPVNLAVDSSFSTQLGNDGLPLDYTIITSLGDATSSNDRTLQGIRGDLSGNYVLGADIDAAATAGWNGTQGFTPIGDGRNEYAGKFDGLGHRINNLYIDRGTSFVGLFGATDEDSVVRNVGIFGGVVVGYNGVGGLVGVNGGMIADAYVISDGVGGDSHDVGGLVGWNDGTIIRSYARTDVSGFGDQVGGLAGVNAGTIAQSHATGAVDGLNSVGGLVGYNYETVLDSYATGSVSATFDAERIGGLAGTNQGRIDRSYATGNVSGTRYVGGLVGWNWRNYISQSHATGDVTGTDAVGGLVGHNVTGPIADAFATGSVTGSTQVGGLIGSNGGALARVYSNGQVIGGTATGALIGHLAAGTLQAAFYDNETSGQGAACGSAAVACVASGLTTAQMRDPFRFIDASWDFSTVWGQSRTGENDGYMVLRTHSATEYEYYVRMSDVNFQRTYGTANPDLGPIALDGIGAGNVTLSWGNAISPGTDAGTYSLGGANVLNRQVSAGTAADYYFDYGRGALTVDRAALVGTLDAASRTYDGQAFSGGSGITWSGFVPGEDQSVLTGALTYGGTAQGARNAGSYTITASGLSAGNYDITYVDGGLTIDPRVISLAGSRVYDGTTDVVASTLALDNLASGESLTLSGIGNLGDRNAGVGKALSLGNLTLGDGSGSASNYTLAGGTHRVDVARRGVSVTNVSAADKVYDGTTAATLDLGSARLAGVIAGDDVGVTGASGAFSDKNAGAGKTVSVTGLALSGADIGNYTLGSSSTTTTATITPRQIGAVSGITADDKLYDGTTAATLSTNAATVGGVLAGDVLLVASATGMFENRNAGIDKVVNITGLTLAGADAGNYTLASRSSTTTADITPRVITAITGITANDKNYDGTTAVTLNTRGASFVGAIGGDDLVVATAEGRFASADPVEYATVMIVGLSLGGADAGNYILAGNTGTTTASIGAIAVPPLQPGQGTDTPAERMPERLFPMPTHDVLASDAPLIDDDASIEHEPAARPERQSETDCDRAPNANGESRCLVPPSSEQPTAD